MTHDERQDAVTPDEPDTSPLDLSGRTPDHEERFDQGALDETRWWPYYTPHWSSRAASAARFDLHTGGMTLSIDVDAPPWSAEYDGDVRVSHLQTGQFSGPVGSAVGQHRFRDGRWVNTVRQRIDYPVQLMLDVYELPNDAGRRDASANPLRFDIARVRTFPPL
jgi:hypothetical protein